MNPLERIEQLRDKVYPSSWDNGAFSFFHLTIYLFDGATIDSLKKDKESATCFVALVHEYIHFIQNFTTALGFTNFITYVDLFAVFFGHNILLDKDPAIPTRNGIVDLNFGNKSYYNFMRSAYLGIDRKGGRIVFKQTTLPNFDIVHSTITDPYWQKDVFISHIALDGELVPVNELIAKENMAIVGSYLASGLTIEEAKATINKIWGKEYHVIYSFINALFPTKDSLKLTYYLCEMSLLIVPYNKTLCDILECLKANQTHLATLSEDDIVSYIRVNVNFDKKFQIILNGVTEQLEARIATFSKYEQQYQFYTYLKDVLELFRAGLKERAKLIFTYRSQFDSSFLNHFTEVIKSPILVFPDGQQTMLGEPPESYVNSIAYFSGVLSVFHHTYFEQLVRCPFADVNSLCSHAKGPECESAPLDIYGNAHFDGCLLHNALNIIGLKKPGRV